MSYEINVSKNNRHYFATHERSITSSQELKPILADFIKRFPKSEGFDLSLSYYPKTGYCIRQVTTADEAIKELDKIQE